MRITDGPTGSNAIAGVGALGSVVDLNAGDRYQLFYRASHSTLNETLALTSVDGGTQTSSGTLAAVIGHKYTLTLEGTYSGGTLTLTGTLLDTDTLNSITVSGTDTTPSTGTYFGYRVSAYTAIGSGDDSSITADFDNFSVEGVPEPTSLSLLGMSAAVVALRRRRVAKDQ